MHPSEYPGRVHYQVWKVTASSDEYWNSYDIIISQRRDVFIAWANLLDQQHVLRLQLLHVMHVSFILKNCHNYKYWYVTTMLLNPISYSSYLSYLGFSGM